MPASLYEIVTTSAGKRARNVRDRTDIGPVAPPTPPSAPPGFAQVFTDQFATLDTTKWFVYNNSNFGAPMRIGLWRGTNLVAGTGATVGATGGTSLRMLTKREDVTVGSTTYNFTGGMLDTKSVGVYYPRYGRYSFRCKTPHGQGIWPSIWLTAKNGGATMAEIDILEYFHAQLPGKNSTTLHGTDNTGAFRANRYTNNAVRTYFEKPTYTPGWHTWTQDIIPVTDATGTTTADPNAPSSYVRYTTYLDGVKVYEFVDTSALNYTTNGGSAAAFWQIYVQGSQVGGQYVGYPDDPLGYSSFLKTDGTRQGCLISGTPPNTCTITRDGTNYIQAPQFSDPASTLELDNMTIYIFTG